VIYDSYYGEQDDNIAHPPIWQVPVGGDVILNIENRGRLKHNWAIVKRGVAPPAPYTGGQDDALIWYGAGMIYSNNKTTITFVAPPEPGEYLIMCTVENHYPLMQGRLLVQ
jgi:plastocyanin